MIRLVLYNSTFNIRRWFPFGYCKHDCPHGGVPRLYDLSLHGSSFSSPTLFLSHHLHARRSLPCVGISAWLQLSFVFDYTSLERLWAAVTTDSLRDLSKLPDSQLFHTAWWAEFCVYIGQWSFLKLSLCIWNPSFIELAFEQCSG